MTMRLRKISRDSLIGNQIEISLAVLGLGILHAMPLLGQRAQRLAKGR